MNTQLLLIGLIAAFGISSVNAQVSKAEIEQFSINADKVRIAQNIVVPAVIAAYEYKQGVIPLSSWRWALRGADQAAKNPGMAAHAALEIDQSLAAELSEIMSTIVFADKPQVLLNAANQINNAGLMNNDHLPAMVVGGLATRVISEVAGILIRNRANKIINTKYQGASAMLQRRIMRTVLFGTTKIVSHMLTCLVTSIILNQKVGAPLGDFSLFQFICRFVDDTLIPTINYALAELEGHVLAQGLVAEVAAAA
jgi:hypothetical protein